MSAIDGFVEIRLGTDKYNLRYDWSAISEIHQTIGDKALLAIFSASPSVIAKVLYIGLKKNHPDITEDKIMQCSPPIIPLLEDIQTALNYSYYGSALPPENKGDSESDSKKK